MRVIALALVLAATMAPSAQAEDTRAQAPQRPTSQPPQAFNRHTDIGCYNYPDRPGGKTRRKQKGSNGKKRRKRR